MFSLCVAAQSGAVCKGPPDLESAVSVNPSAEVYGALGYWFAENGNLKCAIAALRSALRLDGNSFEIRFNLGTALAESGDYIGSAEHLRVAVRLRPGESNAQKALRMVERELATGAEKHFNRSFALLQANKTNEARKELEAALALKPDYADALGNLGVIFQRQGRAVEAERLFRRAIAADPRNLQHHLNLGLTLTGQKRFTEASHALKQALDLDPNHPAALTAMGMVMIRLRQLDDALGLFRKVVSLQPRSADAHLNLGIALADLGRQAEALQSFDEAVRLAPQLPAAHYNRGRALYDLKRYDEAKTAYETALRFAPADPQAVYRLGLTEARLNQPARAAELLGKAVAADPSNAGAHAELGQVLTELGREEEGLAHLKRAVDLNPKDSQAAYALLRLLAARKSPEASKLGQRVRALKKEELSVTQARALSNFALDAAKEKQWAKAIASLREAIQTCGECAVRAVLHRNLGLIMAQSGDVSGATAELRTARKLDPEDRDVEYALELLPRMRGAKP